MTPLLWFLLILALIALFIWLCVRCPDLLAEVLDWVCYLLLLRWLLDD